MDQTVVSFPFPKAFPSHKDKMSVGGAKKKKKECGEILYCPGEKCYGRASSFGGNLFKAALYQLQMRWLYDLTGVSSSPRQDAGSRTVSPVSAKTSAPSANPDFTCTRAAVSRPVQKDSRPWRTGWNVEVGGASIVTRSGHPESHMLTPVMTFEE